MDNIDVFGGLGVEIRLKEPDDFLMIAETLTRIGVASYERRCLYQSCHILHKRGHYAILHFKELFKIDGKPTNFDETDLARRNTIAKMLENWNFCEIVDPKKVESPIVPVSSIRILSHRESKYWNLIPKYSIGNSRRRYERRDYNYNENGDE